MMPKSMYAIAGMGLAACVLLSLMMQHALKARANAPRHAVAGELDDLFGGQLTAPVEVQVAEHDGKQRILVQMKVAMGLDRKGLAMSAGGVVWSWTLEAGRIPESVTVQVSGAADGRTEEFEVPQPPFFGRPDHAPKAPPPAGGSGKATAPVPPKPAPRPGR